MAQPLPIEQATMDEPVLSERELLLAECHSLDTSIGLILVDSESTDSAFFDDLRDTSSLRLLSDSSVSSLTLESLSKVQRQPELVEGATLAQFSHYANADSIWVLPFSHNGRTSKWLLLFDGKQTLEKSVIENLFLKINWVLTNRQLEQTETQLRDANAWIDQELEEMTRLQQLMLPDRKQTIPGSRIAFTYRAMRGAGGDYIDFLSRRDPTGKTDLHTLGVIVADVTGHGPSAAMEVAMLDAILRTYRPTQDLESPSLAFNYINKHFFTRRERSSFITAVACHYCPVKRTLLYANAGHPHAYIKRGNDIIPIDGGGIPIGVMRDYEWELYEVPIEPNDTLFVYTDVVIETKDPDNHDFGFERLEQALRDSDSEPESLLKSMEAKLKTFCRCQKFQDDMTMCAIQFV